MDDERNQLEREYKDCYVKQALDELLQRESELAMKVNRV